MVALYDVRRLAADLDRFLDQVLDKVHSSQISSSERDGPRLRRAEAVRRKRLEHYLGAMTTAQRLRLSGALHLLSARLEEDLAPPDQRAAGHAA
jgi:hypothetical protein